MTTNTPPSPKTVPPISREFDQLEAALAEQGNIVASLVDALDPILRPDFPSDAGGPGLAPQTPDSGVALRVESLRRQVLALSGRLINILERQQLT